MKNRVYGILFITQLGAFLGAAQTEVRPATNRPPSAMTIRTASAMLRNTDTSAIAVFPRMLDFGPLAAGSSDELSFTVQAVGPGSVSGTATVSAPFRIIAGSPFALTNGQAQVVTVQYAPRARGIYVSAVRLTGGTGANITVMGSATPRPPRPPARPASPRNLRLIAASDEPQRRSD